MIAMESQRRLPHEHRPHVVYIARNADGRALYVGSTSNLKQRRASHLRNKPWAGRVASWDVSPEMPWEEAIAAEERAIAEEKPYFNHQRSAGRRIVDLQARHLLANERRGIEPNAEERAAAERLAAAAMESFFRPST